MGGEDGAVLHIENLWGWFRGGPEREGGWERKTYEGRFTRMIDVQQVRIEIQMCVCICLDSGISSFWGIGTWWKVLGLWSVTTQGLYPERSCIGGGEYHFCKNSKRRKGNLGDGFGGISIFIFAVDYFLDVWVRRLRPKGFDGCHLWGYEGFGGACRNSGLGNTEVIYDGVADLLKDNRFSLSVAMECTG